MTRRIVVALLVFVATLSVLIGVGPQRQLESEADKQLGSFIIAAVCAGLTAAILVS
jgi:hypothetical protein